MDGEGRRPLRSLLERSTGDLLVLLIALTICAGVAVTGLSVIVFAFVNPEADTSVPARFITSVITTLIGLLAGFLAGRTDDTLQREQLNRLMKEISEAQQAKPRQGGDGAA